MTRLLIADDQALVRIGLRKIITSEPGMEVVAEASDGESAITAALRHRPDVVLMDIRMPVVDGIEATRRINASAPDVRVLILTTFGLDEYVYGALRAGASGFMLKDAPPEEILGAIRIVARGEALLAPAVTRIVIETFLRHPVPVSGAPREFEVANARCSTSSCRDFPTQRSAHGSTWARRRRRHSSLASSTSSACATASKRSSTPMNRGLVTSLGGGGTARGCGRENYPHYERFRPCGAQPDFWQL